MTRSTRAEEAPPVPRKKRRPFRREQILDAAVQLFSEHGYHATGMDDIGAAAGITGPGIYRHFRNKEDILDTAVRARAGGTLERAQEIVETSTDARQALEALVDNFVAGVVADPAFVSVVMRERRQLPDDTRTWLNRSERLHVEEWVHVLSQLRPELSDAEARTMVQAALSLCMSAMTYRSGLAGDELASILASMARAALLAGSSNGDGSRRRSARTGRAR